MLSGAIAGLIAALCAHGQPWTLDWYTVDGGGGRASGGGYTIQGTIGQPDAGYAAHPEWQLAGGFWNESLEPTQGPATSQPWVVEQFSGPGYVDGVPLAGLNGGSGFAGPWAQNGAITTGFGFGTYPAAGGALLLLTPQGANGSRRLLAPTATPTEGGEFWISFLMAVGGGPGEGGVTIDQRFRVRLDNSGRLFVDVDGPRGVAEVGSATLVNRAGPHLVVARFTHHGLGSAEHPQIGTAWILNPAQYAALAEAGFTEATLEDNHLARAEQRLPQPIRFSDRLLEFAASGAAPTFTFDEIRLGPDLGSVLAPPPLRLGPTDLIVRSTRTAAFVATGGKQPYVFKLGINRSGGSIDPVSGLYTAGPRAGFSDEVGVVDAQGQRAVATVRVVRNAIVVTTTADSGPGSLRQALLTLNATPGGDRIEFEIPGPGPHKIAPLSPLPRPEQNLVLDGFSQAGAQPNTLSRGTDAVLMIELSGENTTGAGLSWSGPAQVTIRGLCINRWDAGIATGCLACGSGIGSTPGGVIAGCFIGTDPGGTEARPNRDGVLLSEATGARLGGPDPGDRNLISGNQRFGVGLGDDTDSFTRDITVQNNLIGTDRTGQVSLGNGGDGIGIFDAGSSGVLISGLTIADNVISGNGGAGIRFAEVNPTSVTDCLVLRNLIGIARDESTPLGNALDGLLLSGRNNRIGGRDPADANVIAYNGGAGVRLPGQNGSGSGNSVQSNRIFQNGGLALDLGRLGPDAADPGDGDTGPNDLQNSPVLVLARNLADRVQVQGTMNCTANTTFVLEFFLNTSADPSGFGEGEQFLGRTEVTTDARGAADFTIAFPGNVPLGLWVTATATNPEGSTSEYSRAIGVTAATFSILGTINDAASGAGIPDLVIEAAGNGSTLAVATDSQGSFVVPDLSPGVYEVTPLSLTRGSDFTYDVPTRAVVLAAADQAVSFRATRAVFRVTGRVRDESGRPIPGADVKATGPFEHAATTTFTGDYVLRLPPGLDFNLSAAKPGFRFDPAQVSLHVDANHGADFTGSLVPRTVRGVIANARGVPTAGVQVFLVGSALTETLTDAAGRFAFQGLSPDTYTLLPSQPNSSFLPADLTVSVVDGDAEVGFVFATSYRISGRLQDASGRGLGRAAVFFESQLPGEPGVTRAATSSLTNGEFQSPLLPEGRTYAVRPVLTNHRFDPVSRLVPNLTADVEGVGFVGLKERISIAGRITNPAGFGLSGVRVRIQPLGFLATSASDGGFVVRNLPGTGRVTVTPERPGFTFDPTQRSFEAQGVDLETGFLATPLLPLTGRIAARDPASGTLLVMNADGSARLSLETGLADPAGPAGYRAGNRLRSVALSPDGQRIALSSPTGSGRALFVMNSDGSDVRRLTPLNGMADHPAWSPDGTRLAFTRSGDAPDHGINVVARDGSDLRYVAGTANAPASAFDQFPAWSPDGTRLLMDRHLHPVWSRLREVTPQGERLRHSALFSSLFNAPAWSPDGAEVLLSRLATGGFRHDLVRLDPVDLGRHPLPFRPLTTSPGHDLNPAWSPDGSLVVFERAVGAAANLFVVRDDGSGLTRLAQGSGPTWGPTPALPTPTGSNVRLQSGLVTVTFGRVQNQGTTTILPVPPPTSLVPPGYVTLDGLGWNFEISTTADVSGPILVCFTVPADTTRSAFKQLRILHAENGLLVDRTVLPPETPAPDFAARTICGHVESLSPFFLAQSIDPALPGLSGLVVDPEGNPLSDIRLALDPADFPPARTDLNGAFAFPNLDAEHSYVVRPVHARYDFTPPLAVVPDPAAASSQVFVAVPKPGPVLSVTFDPARPGGLVLSWPAATGEYRLESTPSLDPGDWMDVVENPVLEGESWNMSVQTGGERRFYRLRPE